MRILSSSIVVLCLFVVGCGGSNPVAPSNNDSIPSASNPTPAPGPAPAPAPSPAPVPVPGPGSLQLTPSSATLSVGQSVTFTVSGGDGYNYVWSDPEPFWAFQMEILNAKSVRVTVVDRSYGLNGKIRVEGIVGNTIGHVDGTITIK